MKLYLVKRNDFCRIDENDSFVIRARSSIRARQIANSRCMDEGNIWEDVSLVTVRELKQEGKEDVICTESMSG